MRLFLVWPYRDGKLHGEPYVTEADTPEEAAAELYNNAVVVSAEAFGAAVRKADDRQAP